MRLFCRMSFVIAVILFWSCAVAPAYASSFQTAPSVIRPGRSYEIVIEVSQGDSGTLQLLDEHGEPIHTIYERYPLVAGTNVLVWDGLRSDMVPVPEGEYSLSLTTDAGAGAQSPVRVGTPYPRIYDVTQTAHTLHEGSSMEVSFGLSEQGLLDISILDNATGNTQALASLNLSSGKNNFRWYGMVNGTFVSDGVYTLLLTLASDHESSETVRVEITTVSSAPAPTEAPAITEAPEVEEVIVTPEPTEQPAVSPPYSSVDDGTYWSMTPGELDDAVIWEILTQPITVYDGGLQAAAKTHAYMMENPDGTGAQVAQLHAQSQGLHVIGETNEHGYVLVEAFSNYDDSYNPKTDEEREHAFDLKQGYVLAEHLKTVEVNQEIAFLVDKLTQRMYMFVDGVRVTEFLIATGKITEDKYYNETTPGEFITISHTGGFWSGNMYCDMAIRINGGILLHEVPHKVNADGTRNYASFEAYLGSKQSHGCIRVQRLKNPEGYNHQWLWDNLKRAGGHKVIIWDDMNPRYDTPATWQENPGE